MHKARFTEHQVIAVLKSIEGGRMFKDVCRSEPQNRALKDVIENKL